MTDIEQRLRQGENLVGLPVQFCQFKPDGYYLLPARLLRRCRTAPELYDLCVSLDVDGAPQIKSAVPFSHVPTPVHWNLLPDPTHL